MTSARLLPSNLSEILTLESSYIQLFFFPQEKLFTPGRSIVIKITPDLSIPVALLLSSSNNTVYTRILGI